MTSITDMFRRVREGREATPPFLGDATGGTLAVARDCFEHPETVTLPDGRTLGYAETGDPDGTPVLAFHGVPSGRLGAAVFDGAARAAGLRLVAPERPGVGVSDPDPDRTLTDWPADVTALLDALGVEEAPVVGVSGGGPYALACGALVPERVPRVAVCCGVGPMAAVGPAERLLFLLARGVPGVVRAFLGAEERSARYAPERTVKRRAAAAAPHDRERWSGEIGRVLVASIPAACRHHGVEAFVRDLQLFASDWGFDLALDVPVGLWYGRADRYVPVAMGQYLMEAVPTAEAHFYPDLGHLSTVMENDSAMFGWLRE
ncbi:alpha/beta fold hydrolase [Halomarina litorea]|uniref:alpha/beta fold hydrolase n=1 Tax=Halomarina litorea TaxID=2961595 RepID=UPI0020C3FCE8|nr:alpha/beta hydrolase [Halomarina sp. BCD28]